MEVNKFAAVVYVNAEGAAMFKMEASLIRTRLDVGPKSAEM